MKPFRILIALSLVLAFAACSSVHVREVDADKDFNLAEYNTFTFYDSNNDSDTLLGEYQEEMNLIKKEVAEQLQARGLSQSPEADLMVNIGAVVEEKLQTRPTTIQEAPVYIGQRRYHWESKEVVTGRYNVGTVTVHLVDREENKLVWKGVAEGVISKNQEKLRKNIAEGVSKLFKKVP